VTSSPGGPVWGAASADLNATLLEWRAGAVRELDVGPDGVRYLTAHVRRDGLEIERP
jgi:hypothetical protein